MLLTLASIQSKLNRHIVSAGALRRVKSNPPSCAKIVNTKLAIVGFEVLLLIPHLLQLALLRN